MTSTGISPIEKSAIALLKIRQLIEVGYGGNVTHDEWVNDIKENNLWSVYFDYYDNEFYPIFTAGHFTHVAFHTKEQAEEFLSYPENIQLLKDYFMLPVTVQG